MKILVLLFVHFAVCAKLEQGLGILIAFPMIFELLLLISGIQGYERYLQRKKMAVLELQTIRDSHQIANQLFKTD
ncbi:Oidioi.mRNA.OKI2018_I69.chr1.g3793.t1.cds [Oikopleura dioica]|uniref:Oidioi.mRNA.OKI2018_I69.chr1.g3793.t1.cds n=1 Tax=Oikopleura dioica TaxID=34765 RepID=A0ABN7SVT2_OIKDI|nr:Oidioi.mRNA.OKI2018_I69.chr1.g3793.t1.cds [Oikopleura dioica]